MHLWHTEINSVRLKSPSIIMQAAQEARHSVKILQLAIRCSRFGA